MKSTYQIPERNRFFLGGKDCFYDKLKDCRMRPFLTTDKVGKMANSNMFTTSFS